MRKGFTIAELLVAISVIAVIGAVVAEVFSRSLRGGNKAQIIGVVKQNGQATLEAMDKTLRNSDEIVCPVITIAELTAAGVNPVIKNSDTATVVKDGKYTRFRYKAPVSGVNGYILQDNPVYVAPLSQESFLNDVCSNAWNDPNSPAAVYITDTNTKNGVSVTSATANIFIRNKQAGFRDILTINFDLKPGAQVPAAISGQIDPVTFTTTIQLR